MLHRLAHSLLAGLLFVSILGLPISPAASQESCGCRQNAGSQTRVYGSPSSPGVPAASGTRQMNYVFDDDQQTVQQPVSGQIVEDGGFYEEGPFDGTGCESCECGPAYCRPPRIWGGAEALGWWISGMETPVLASSGTLDQAGTRIYYGGSELNNDPQAGVRFRLGGWLDDCQCFGVEGTFLKLGEASNRFSASNDNVANLVQPYFDVDEWAADGQVLVGPTTIRAGSLDILADTDFQTANILVRRLAAESERTRVEFLCGYRYAQLIDRLATHAYRDTVGIGTLDSFDAFSSTNNFHGVEFGVNTHRMLNPLWSFEVTGKTALGATRSVIDISGSSRTIDVQGNSEYGDGGLLAQRSNIGSHSKSGFSVLGELELTLHYRINPRWEAAFGYTLMGWSGVRRAGEQVDTTVQIPQDGTTSASASPRVRMEQSDFWAQGLRLGLDCAF